MALDERYRKRKADARPDDNFTYLFSADQAAEVSNIVHRFELSRGGVHGDIYSVNSSRVAVTMHYGRYMAETCAPDSRLSVRITDCAQDMSAPPLMHFYITVRRNGDVLESKMREQPPDELSPRACKDLQAKVRDVLTKLQVCKVEGKLVGGDESTYATRSRWDIFGTRCNDGTEPKGMYGGFFGTRYAGHCPSLDEALMEMEKNSVVH